jgi:hypothetical protein
MGDQNETNHAISRERKHAPKESLGWDDQLANSKPEIYPRNPRYDNYEKSNYEELVEDGSIIF